MAADDRGGPVGSGGSTDLRDPGLSGDLAQVDARAGRADETAALLDEESVGGLWRRVVVRLMGAQQKFHVL